MRYVWDMCGVRYANNLLKNPATKRLSGKKKLHPGLGVKVFNLSTDLDSSNYMFSKFN